MIIVSWESKTTRGAVRDGCPSNNSTWLNFQWIKKTPRVTITSFSFLKTISSHHDWRPYKIEYVLFVAYFKASRNNAPDKGIWNTRTTQLASRHYTATCQERCMNSWANCRFRWKHFLDESDCSPRGKLVAGARRAHWHSVTSFCTRRTLHILRLF